MVGHFPLEGDGCVAALFHYIWSKNSHKKSCPLVNVPDTVVYKYRQPAYWYFTSKDSAGGVKMKNKTNRELLVIAQVPLYLYVCSSEHLQSGPILMMCSAACIECVSSICAPRCRIRRTLDCHAFLLHTSVCLHLCPTCLFGSLCLWPYLTWFLPVHRVLLC